MTGDMNNLSNNMAERERDRNRRDARSEDRIGRDRSPVARGGGRGRRDARVFVSNLPYDYRWQDLKDLFRKEIGEVSYAELFTDENDKGRGCGIVEFESTEAMKKAIDKLHRHEVEGRKIVVKEENGEGRRFGTRGRDRQHDQRDDRWEGGRDILPNKPIVWGETYGLSPSFLEGLGIAPPLVHKVFVANLDYKVTEKKLKEVFKLAGHVQEVELSVDADGKSRGFAVVEFQHPVESVQAISMLHNQQLFDRRLTVRMDRVDSDNRLPEGLMGVGMGLGQNGTPLRDVSRNLPNLTGGGAGGANPMAALQNQSNFSHLTSAALSAAVPTLGGLGSLQAAAALNNSGNSLLGPAGNLDLLGRNDLTARDLALSNLGLGNSALSNTGFSSNRNFTGESQDNKRVTSRNDIPSLTSLPDLHPGSRDNFDRGAGYGNAARNLSDSAPPKSSDTVMVDGLPYNFTWQNLKDKFREVGDVKFAEMRGKIGLIRFSSDWEAMRAVSVMDQTRIDGRPIQVRLY